MEKATTPKRGRGRGRGRGKGRGAAKPASDVADPVQAKAVDEPEPEAETPDEEVPTVQTEESQEDAADTTEMTDEQLLQENAGDGHPEEEFEEEGYEDEEMEGGEENYEQFEEEEFYDEEADVAEEGAEEAKEGEEKATEDKPEQEEEKKDTTDEKSEEKAEASKEEDDKKADKDVAEEKDGKSKSKEPAKKRGFPPKPKHSNHLDIGQMIRLVRAEWGYCTVYVGPIQVENLAEEVFKKATHTARWSAFRYFRKLDNEQFGTLELRFRSRDEANECTKELEAVEDKAYVIKNFRQLKEGNSKIPYFLSVVDMEEWSSANRNMLYSQLENVGVNSDSVWVYIENIPEDMSENDLRQELESCAEVVYPRDSDGKPQGYCYAHMSDISTRAEFTAKSKDEESVTIRGQSLHVYRLMQGHGVDRFKRTMPMGGGPMMKRPRPDGYGSGNTYSSNYKGTKPYDNRASTRGQGRYSPPTRGRFRGVSGGYRPTRGGSYGASGGFRDTREEGGVHGVHKLLSGLEKILERHERDDRPSRGGGGGSGFSSRDFGAKYGDAGSYGRRDFGAADKYQQKSRFSRESYGSGGAGVDRSHRAAETGGRYGARDDSRGYGAGYGGSSGRYSPHRSSGYGTGQGSSRLPFGSGGAASWGSGYMGN